LFYRKAARVCYRSLAVLACVAPAVALCADLGVVKQQANIPSKSVDAAQNEPLLEPAEPITGGETYDSDDTYFMDVNLSVKIRLTPKQVLAQFRPFFAMNTRFGFYWGSRLGSPVIGKSYNPELFFRFLPQSSRTVGCTDCNGFEYSTFFNIGYAHQSNGQLIHTFAEYQQQLSSTPPSSYANNFIHRGWDYVHAVWKQTFVDKRVTLYAEGKYFLPHGLLQGDEDEYHSWEDNPEGKARDAVDGLELTIDWPSENAHFTVDSDQRFSRPNLTVRYLTGYQRFFQSPFRYNSIRGEFGFQIYSLPLALWVQHGYMSSLADYYKNVDSVGIEVRFESF
jgi:hypothetical protein